MIILRCTNDNNVVQDIQIQEQIDLRLDISAIENTTIGDVYGISSQEFSVPGNNETNQFFGNLYNLGATAAVALQNSIDCQVLLDGAEVFRGKLYIKNIITDSDGYNTLYNVVVTNETVDFKFEIQNVYINQLDFSALDHDLTYANVSESWGGGLKNGNVIYPFVNYGKPEGDPDAPDFAFAAFNSTGSNTIDNFASPLRLIDFKPAIRAKYVVDALFSGSSYDYTSSFFNSEYFENLYVLPTPNDTLGPNNVSPVSQSAWAYNESGSQSIPANNLAKIDFDAEVVDNGNSFSLVNDRYTANSTGTYQYNINVNYTTVSWAPSNANTVTIQLRKNGGSIVASQFYYNIPATGSATLTGGISLVAGDYLEVEMAPVGKAINILNEVGKPSYLPAGYQTYFQVKGPSTAIGANVDMAEQFPDDLKALDFLQGLIEKFNLVVEPVPNSRNLIRIEPYQNWIDAGVSKDWTDKVDRSEKFEISHPITEQPRTIVFSDEDDTDVLNAYSTENKGVTYGSYTFTSDSDLAEGTRRIGKVFAATPVTGIPNGRVFVIPHLCTVTENNDFRPMKFKPRLLYNNGLQTVPDTALGIQTGSIDRGTIFVRDENATVQATTIWNQMSTLTSIPVDFSTGQDLHFNNDLYSPYFQATANGKTKADAFRTYWATYINGLYDFDARKLTCNVYLKPTEIQNIALNDKLFIDGAYYRINRINGANLTRRDTVEVELIKILQAQYKFPKRRIFTAPGDYISAVSDYGLLSIDGTGRYINVDTGLPIEDFTQLRQVASKDGFQLYNNSGTGSLVWDYQQPVDNTNQFDQKVLGTNKVGAGASKVNAIGNNNEVKQGSETSLVVGSNNLVAENTSNVTTIGQGHTVEAAVSNAQILGGVGNTVSSSRESVIMGGTGSLFVNNDWVVDINGNTGAIRDSDFTTALNRAENEVIINGSGHTVINLNLEGAGLNLLNTRANSAWLGDTYLGESLFIDSITKNIGDGTRIDLTGSLQGQGRHETLYILNWNGLSPGTANIGLPNATNNDYTGVVYTFKGSNFSTGDSVVINTFTGGQTIDGNATYTLSGASGSAPWVTLHASGGDWYVLNEFSVGGGGGTPVTSGSFTGSFSGSFTGSLLGTASFATSASYALSASKAECADRVTSYNVDQPEQGDIYYSTFVLGTGSSCDYLFTSDLFAPYFVPDDNTLYFPTPTSGSFKGSFSGSFTGSITSASYAATASYAPNIYNIDGELTDNRTVTLGGNNLTFVADQGETFEIASDPASDVLISGLPLISGSNVVYYNSTNGKLSYGPAVSGSTTGSAGFPYTGSAQITGSLRLTGSFSSLPVTVTAAAGTASVSGYTGSIFSVDATKGNFFNLSLVTSSLSILDVVNMNDGQEIYVKIFQSASVGADVNTTNLQLNSNILVPDNTRYIPSNAVGNIDQLTITYQDSTLLASYDKQFVSFSIAAGGAFVSASGGTETISGSFRIHTFTSSSALVVHQGGNVETLVVAGGGGGGGNTAGGGGAGGLIYSSSFTIPTTASLTVTIGGGGSGGTGGNPGGVGGNGTNSVFYTLTATGGGGGGGYSQSTLNGSGSNGGSGGGGGSAESGFTNLGGTGVSGQGSNGGNGAPTYAGGGGGGAGAVGAAGTSATDQGGAGGDGLAYNFTGSSVYYAGGGGGGSYTTFNAAGGLGGGGTGAQRNGSGQTAGTANTGGGGGGGGENDPGANGGSGIVIIKYQYQ